MSLLAQIPLVTRRVIDDAATVGVELSRTYTASARELWEAITDPHRLEHWFEPVDPADIEILTCRAEERLEIRWESGTLGVTIDDNTLTLTYSTERNELWETYGPAIHGIGWDAALAALALHLAMDAENDEGEDEEFLRRVVAEWSVDKHQAQRTTALILE
ncbi:hypothetical protein [Corynebacterium sp.]|uniref:hypothetical protein n=1 Tax=Corynebacterium sp. TaxID=1720 RepID=UPI0026DF2A97|nr:hypothetical protein [Corynebacterium sp.]MDO5512979.1 hypothetical protein [Corynebacterium sp.]